MAYTPTSEERDAYWRRTSATNAALGGVPPTPEMRQDYASGQQTANDLARRTQVNTPLPGSTAYEMGAGARAASLGLREYVQNRTTDAMSKIIPSVSGLYSGLAGAEGSFYQGASGSPPSAQMRPPSPTPNIGQASGTAQMKSVGPGEGIPGAADYIREFDPNRVGVLPGDTRQPSPATQPPSRSVRVPPGTQYTEDGVGRIPTFSMEPTQSRPDFMRESPERGVRRFQDLQAAQTSLRDAQYLDARRRAGDIIRPPGQPRDPLPIAEFRRADDIMRGTGPAVPGNLASFSRLRNAREAAESLRATGRERLGYQAKMEETGFKEGESMRRLQETGRQEMDRDFMADQRSALENRRNESAGERLERVRQQGELSRLDRGQELGRETDQIRRDRDFADLQRTRAYEQAEGAYDLTSDQGAGMFAVDLLRSVSENAVMSTNPQKSALQSAVALARTQVTDPDQLQMVLSRLAMAGQYESVEKMLKALR